MLKAKVALFLSLSIWQEFFSTLPFCGRRCKVMFRQCNDCDFEWHESDGKDCPACGSASMDSESEDESDSAARAEMNEGGAFGSGPYAKSQASCMVALAIMALVYFIVRFVLGG